MRILADWFGISKSSVTCIINTQINLLYQILKDQLIWPSADQVKSTLPASFSPKYADTKIILDCTEFSLVKPKNCFAQASTYSQYKHQNTIKVLIGITHRGLITFVSNPYGGNTSDQHIAEMELLGKIEPGDAIMVDRGFNIGDLLLHWGAKLYMPSFTRKAENGKGKALNQSEILKTRNIVSLRIHVEWVIERIQIFKILSNRFTFNLWPLPYQVLVIVSVFYNFQPPLLKYQYLSLNSVMLIPQKCLFVCLCSFSTSIFWWILLSFFACIIFGPLQVKKGYSNFADPLHICF